MRVGVADDVPQVGADAVRAALHEGMAGGAALRHGLAFRDAGGGEQRRDRRQHLGNGGGAAGRRGTLDAGDDVGGEGAADEGAEQDVAGAEPEAAADGGVVGHAVGLDFPVGGVGAAAVVEVVVHRAAHAPVGDECDGDGDADHGQPGGECQRHGDSRGRWVGNTEVGRRGQPASAVGR